MIIGLVGILGSGKTTVAQYLQEKGFIIITLSKYIKNYITNKGEEINRNNLRKYGEYLRYKYGNNFLIIQALKDIDFQQNYVIDGIRHLDELQELKKHINTYILYIKINKKNALNRLGLRNRQDDQIINKYDIINMYLHEKNDLLKNGLFNKENHIFYNFIYNNNRCIDILYKYLSEILAKMKLL